VELMPSGPLTIAPAAPRAAYSQPTIRTSRTARVSGGLTYLFRCSVCNKRFDRKSYDAALRPHKNRDGRDCYGRYGVYEGTKY
jgi:hypothetical protein